MRGAVEKQRFLRKISTRCESALQMENFEQSNFFLKMSWSMVFMNMQSVNPLFWLKMFAERNCIAVDSIAFTHERGLIENRNGGLGHVWEWGS